VTGVIVVIIGGGFYVQAQDLVRPVSFCCARAERESQNRQNKYSHHLAIDRYLKEEGIGLVEVLGRMTMQVFVRDHCSMIAAPVQCDVDEIPKGSHFARVLPMG